MPTALIAIWLPQLLALVTPDANVILLSQLAASDRTRSALFAAIDVTVGAAMSSSAGVLGVNAVFETFSRSFAYASKHRLLNRTAGSLAGVLSLGLALTSIREARRDLVA